MLDEASETMTALREVATSIESNADVVVSELTKVTDDLSVLLDSTNRVMIRSIEGPGTISQLLKNPDLYDSLLDTIEQLQRAIIDFQQLVDKFREEGLIF